MRPSQTGVKPVQHSAGPDPCPDVASPQSGSNPVAVWSLRSQSGPSPVPVRLQSDSNPVPVRSQSGPNPVPVRSQSGPNPAPVRSQSGPCPCPAPVRNFGSHAVSSAGQSDPFGPCLNPVHKNPATITLQGCSETAFDAEPVAFI
jgi:hypothetical protein